MHAMLCDACRQPMTGEGFEVALLRGIVVHVPDEPAHLAATEGIVSATLCSRCGDRLTAILQRKLSEPCPVCELEPMRFSDEHTLEKLRRAS